VTARPRNARCRAAVQQVGEPAVQVDLDQDRHRQQSDHERPLLHKLLPLEAEQQDQGREQGADRDRLEPPAKALEAVGFRLA
jgi:hypothetical protein